MLVPMACYTIAQGITRTLSSSAAGCRWQGVILRRSVSALVLGVLWGWFTPTLEAQETTAVFETVADTYLRRGSPNQSLGGETILEIKSGPANNRVLVRFDVAAVAAAVGQGTLVSAELELFIQTNGGGWGASGRAIDVHRVTSAWTEAGATWNCAADANPANTQPDCNPRWNGGSVDPAVSATRVHTNTLTGAVRFDLTQDVAAQLAGAEHFGWSIERGAGVTAGNVDYVAREGAAGQAPRLIVVYGPPPPDTTPPSLAITAPAGPLVINDPAPTVTVEYADGGSGIAPASLRVRSGSLDFTLGCTIGPTSATCRPPFLGSGPRTLSAELRDLAGNRATATASFEILLDDEPPRLAITAPAETLLIGVPAPAIELEYGDIESEVDLATLRVLVDGTEITSSCTVAAGSARCLPAPLAEGPHTVSAEIADRVGLGATATRDFTLDLDPVAPVIAFATPSAGPVLLAAPPLAIELTYADADTGLDLSSFGLFADGEERSDGCELSATGAVCALDLTAGSHAFEARIADRAGNVGATALAIDLALDPAVPTLAILTPDQPSYLGDAPAITLEHADVGSGLDLATVRVRIGSADLTATCAVSAAGTSCPPPALVEGAHTLTAEVRDRAGNRAVQSRTFELRLRDRIPPTLTLLSPQGGVLLSGGVPQIEVAYEDLSGIDTASLFVAIDGESITPSCHAGLAQATCRPSSLAAGEHALRIELRDLEGNLAILTESFTLEYQLPVHVDEPATGALTTALTVTVRGTVSPAADAVTVGEVAAVVSNGTFVAEDVPLHEGANVLSAVATSALGGLGTDTVTVVRDTLRPQVVVFSPHDGSTTHAQQILVSGEVNDPSSSSSAQTPPVVRVNEIETEVEQRAFVVPGFLLQPGENVITVEATDAAGNLGAAEVRVTYVPGASQRIEEILGNGQTGTVATRLAEPLMVRLADFAGQPLAGRRVKFEVSRGNGVVESFPESGPSVETLTDANGIAQVLFTLGERSGRGNHEVTATSPGIRGEVVFCASAEPTGPRRIKRIVGNIQTGAQVAIAGAEAPYPLLTQVFDDHGNPVAGAAVTYTVLAGDGHFAGEESYPTTTDAAGKALATLTLGPLPGINNNLVEASVEGSAETGALFTFTAVAPREGDTTLSGIVLDNQDAPVPGVTLHVGESTAVADAQGRFTLTGLPVGTVHLGVDGSTATRPGRWPHLGFAFTLVRGIENSLGMPIRLLPIDVGSGRIVGGDADVVVPMSGVPGAELTVFANSVTFPGGAKVGEVTFTQVHADKVPMVAPMGSDFMLAFTIQPPGTVFDPPARVSVPNLGAAPGTIVDMFSFDHDLGEMVNVGTAQVSADGLRLVTTPGSGIPKAGWGGPVASPPPDADTCHPSACTTCPAGATRPEPKCDECSTCNGGSCSPKRVQSVTVKANGESEDEVVVGKKQEVAFTAEAPADCSKKYSWDFGDGNTSEEAEPKHEYEEKGLYTVKLEVGCRDCEDNGSVMDELKVRAIELDLEIDELPEETEAMPHEEDPGVLLVVNDDDDDDNDTPDNEDAGEVQDEDDLVELKIEFDDQVETGEVRLEAVAGGESIKVWEEETRATAVELPKTWKLEEGDEIPESVWIEGIEGSSLKGVEIELGYEAETVKEPITDKVVATAVDVEFDVLPTEPDGVSADDAEYEVVASVFYRDPEDPEKLLPVEDGAEITWELTEGGGSLSPSTSTTENGLATTTLSTSTVPGSRYMVEGKLKKFRLEDTPEGEEIEVELASESEAIVVTPGVPNVIDITASSLQEAADGTGTVSLQALVTDRNGNPVEDGTAVSWLLGESNSDYRQTVTQTVGGGASAMLLAPIEPIEQVVEVRAGTVSATETIGFDRIEGSLVSSDQEIDVATGETATLTLSASAADGTPVFWFTSNGVIAGSSVLSGGQAVATLATTGGSPAPVVVTATVGSRLFWWQGEFRSSDPVEVFVENRFLVTDQTESGFMTVTRPDGKVSSVPFFTSTQVHVRGPAGGLGLVSRPGQSLREAYAFENEAEGAVPGLIAGLPLTLGGATLDDALAHTGIGSLLFTAGDTASIPSDPALDFHDDLGISFWLRASQLAATPLIAREGSWSIELLADGRVRARVSTDGGAHELTSAEILPFNDWVQITLEGTGSGLSLRVGAETQRDPGFTGGVAASQAAVILGGQLEAHLDDLTFSSPGSTTTPFVFGGLGAAGTIQLDANGEAVFEITSGGDLSAPDFGAERSLFGVTVLADGAAALRKTRGLSQELSKAIPDRFIGEGTVFGIKTETWEQVGDAVVGFFGGDTTTTAGTIANVAGGVLIVGDVGAVVKNLWRMAGFSEKDPNYPELVLSGLGLITEFAVGVGEIADVPISFARAIAQRIGNSPLARIIVKQLKDWIVNGKAFSQSKIDLLRALFNSQGATSAFNALIKSEDVWEAAARAQAKLGDAFAQSMERALASFGEDVAKKMINVLGDLSDDAIAGIRGHAKYDEAIDGLGKALRQGIDPQLMKRVLENENILGTTYRQADLLADLGKVDQIPGFDKLVNALKIETVQAKGFRYELEVAVALGGNGGGVQALGQAAQIPGFVPPRFTDIDVLAGGIAYQAKRSADAVGYGKKGLESARKWVAAVLPRVGNDPSRVKYAIPDGVDVPPQVAEFLRNFKPSPIQVVRIAHAKTLEEARRIWEKSVGIEE